MQALQMDIKIKYPELLPVAEKLGWSYEKLLAYIENN